MPPSSLMLTEIQLFSLTKHSIDRCKALVNLQGSEKVVSDHFSQCSYCLMEKSPFECPHSTFCRFFSLLSL